MSRDRSLDVAVTGMAARFPGCADLDEWWSAVQAGRVLTRRYERPELLAAGVPADVFDDSDYVPVRGHLDDADRFENGLFRVSPRDAEMMDPQHRLMLEAAWAALEDAGSAFVEPIPVTGVFASGSGSGYLRAMLARGPLDAATLDQALHGCEPDFIAGLISYKLGLTGPALAVQTACSSGLVGVHLAVQSLLTAECNQAVVVAAGIDWPQSGHLHLPGGIQSPSGQCRPFDESADGVVAGSGVACVVLRRLSDALEECASPLCVILGTAINNDGSNKAGYYAPSPDGQEAAIKSAFRAADIDASSVRYLESHGTGTRVGDPIEWSAASAALSSLGAAPGQIALGAVKANMGHLDAAAGIAGLIKAIHVVRDGIIPPVAGFMRLNPLLDADGSPLYVPTSAGPWTGGTPRRAGVSSFGIGGTNAHVIIEEPPAAVRAERSWGDRPRLVVLSAADDDALTRSSLRLAEQVAAREVSVADVAFTLLHGRARLPHRLAVTGATGSEIADRLATGATARGCTTAAEPAPLIFMFPGQGGQHPGMATTFVETIPDFDGDLERCLDALDHALAHRVRRAVLDPDFPASEIESTDLAQPALFVLQHALASALRRLGLHPVAIVGHSLGELTAACFAGSIDLADAAQLVAARGRAMHACPRGAMLAIACSEGEALALLEAAGSLLELAAVNGPELCVLSGPFEAVDAFRASLGDQPWTRVLRTSHAFHSRLMEPALDPLAVALQGIEIGPLAMPLAANATGAVLPMGARLSSDHFVDQARRPVQFASGLTRLSAVFPGAVLVEVGPGRSLTAMAEALELDAVPVADDPLLALGRLWTVGQPVVLDALCGPGNRVHLPTYPFAGPRWLTPEVAPESARAAAPAERPSAPSPPDGADVVRLLWIELLGHHDLTDDADFFDLGGDSLLVTHMARRLKEALGVHVPLRAMLAARTLQRQRAVVLELLES